MAITFALVAVVLLMTVFMCLVTFRHGREIQALKDELEYCDQVLIRITGDLKKLRLIADGNEDEGPCP